MPIPSSDPVVAGTATLADLVNEVRYLLRSFTGQHDRTTHLAAGLSDTALSVSVADGSIASRGVIEIDDEIIWVDSSAGGTLTVPPYGRGYQATIAATHPQDTQVLVDPMVPKQAIKRSIAETQRAVYPKLFQVKSTEFTFSAAQSSYEMPADADRIISVTAKSIGPSGFWHELSKYRLDTNTNTTAFTTGRAIHLGQAAPAGQTVRVLYAAPFTVLSANTDTLASAGHDASHWDVLVFGTTARLVQYLESSRLSMNAVENAERSKYAPNGAASALTRQLLGWYEQRMAEERQKLLDRFPVNRSYRR